MRETKQTAIIAASVPIAPAASICAAAFLFRTNCMMSRSIRLTLGRFLPELDAVPWARGDFTVVLLSNQLQRRQRCIY